MIWYCIWESSEFIWRAGIRAHSRNRVAFSKLVEGITLGAHSYDLDKVTPPGRLNIMTIRNVLRTGEQEYRPDQANQKLLRKLLI